MGKSISKLNKEWHLAHPMPKNATIEERIGWHLEHSKHCECRPYSGEIKSRDQKEKSPI